MIRTATLAAALFLSSGIAAPMAIAAEAGVIGIWDTGNEGGRVEITRCGQSLCGRIIDAIALRANPNLLDRLNKNSKLRNRKLKNLVVLENFTGGPILYKGGPVYDPESGDRASRGELKLVGTDKLEVKGCVAFICRTKIWTRVG